MKENNSGLTNEEIEACGNASENDEERERLTTFFAGQKAVAKLKLLEKARKKHSLTNSHGEYPFFRQIVSPRLPDKLVGY